MRFLLFLIFLDITSLAGQVTFQRTFGGPLVDEAFYVTPAAGGFIMAGTTDQNTNGGTDACVLKTDFSGNLLWMKNVGGANNELAIFANVLPNGDVVCCGETFSYGSGNGDGFLCRFDSTGNLLWMKTYGDSLYDIAYSFAPTADGGFIISGLIQEGPADFDAFLIRTDGAGDTLWTKRLGGPGIDHAVSVIQTADGGFAFSGKCLSYGAGSSDIYFVRTDAAGDTLWTRVIGGGGWDEGMCLRELPSGDFAICGGTNSFGQGNYDQLLLKTNASGVVTWWKTYGGSNIEAAYGMSLTNDGGFIFTGYTETFGEGHAPVNDPVVNPLGTDSANVMTIRTDQNGDTLWCRSYGGAKKEESFMVLPVYDGGFVIGGYSSSFSNDSDNVYFIRTDSLGRSGCFEEPISPQVSTHTPQQRRIPSQIRSGMATATIPTNENAVQPGVVLNCLSTATTPEYVGEKTIRVFPNPSDGDITIDGLTNGNHILKLYDLPGRLLSERVINAESPRFSFKEMNAGVYLLQIDNLTPIKIIAKK